VWSTTRRAPWGLASCRGFASDLTVLASVWALDGVVAHSGTNTPKSCQNPYYFSKASQLILRPKKKSAVRIPENISSLRIRGEKSPEKDSVRNWNSLSVRNGHIEIWNQQIYHDMSRLWPFTSNSEIKQRLGNAQHWRASEGRGRRITPLPRHTRSVGIPSFFRVCLYFKRQTVAIGSNFALDCDRYFFVWTFCWRQAVAWRMGERSDEKKVRGL